MTKTPNDSAARQSVSHRKPVPVQTPAPLLDQRMASFRRKLADSTADALYLGLDFDGTLAPHVDDPTTSSMRDGNRELLERLVDCPATVVAVISGRELADLRERVDVDGIRYAGNHGLEMDSDSPLSSPDSVRASLDRVCAMLRTEFDSADGVRIEYKGVTATVHYRTADTDDDGARLHRRVETIVENVLDDCSLRVTAGQDVVELRPAIDWDKGRAFEQFIEQTDQDVFPVFVGDDTTDEDAFRAINGRGIGIHVGTEETLANYRVNGPADVSALLAWCIDTAPDLFESGS